MLVLVLVLGLVLVLLQWLQLTHLGEDSRHLEGPRGVHVGGDDGDAGVGLFGVAECEGPLKVDLKGARAR